MNPSKPNPKSTTPPDWFTSAIGEGLGSLYAMSMEGCPAADIVEATKAIWVADLWQYLRHSEPTQGVDLPRIRAAFHKLRTTVRRWPQQAQFLEALPKRPEPKRAPALPPGDIGEEERAIRRLKNETLRQQMSLSDAAPTTQENSHGNP